MFTLREIPIYPAFEKECKCQEGFRRRIEHLENKIYYPEPIIEQWTEISCCEILEGRTYFSRVCGYKVNGLIDFNAREYHVTIKGKIMNRENQNTYSNNYQNIPYDIIKISSGCQGIFEYGDVMYTVFVYPSDIYANSNEAEEVVLHNVEVLMDGILSR